MHNETRGISLFFVLVALAMVSFLSTNAYAQTGLQSPQVEAAKIKMNWSKVARQHSTRFMQLRSKLRPADEYATLYAMQIALSRVGDGQTFIWSRPKRQLRALITPLSSWRHVNGSICRKISVSLVLGTTLKHMETIACRNKKRVWQMQS
ncbi:MAG: hypothetical protein L3J67_08855 [Hyphomicrobiaceae bacterium]|nr:hypothetical protein [Hyphomicrobiaceae bacterium]